MAVLVWGGLFSGRRVWLHDFPRTRHIGFVILACVPQEIKAKMAEGDEGGGTGSAEVIAERDKVRRRN